MPLKTLQEADTLKGDGKISTELFRKEIIAMLPGKSSGVDKLVSYLDIDGEIVVDHFRHLRHRTPLTVAAEEADIAKAVESFQLK